LSAGESVGKDLWRDAALAAAVAFLPFVRGVLQGGCFFFRDLSLYFFPLRRFAIEGLLAGELRYWNPYVHEGVPVSLPPVSYPPDLLQLLWPDERGFSLLLALHVPLAAAALVVLARSLGIASPGAVGGAIVYALGGYCLSSLNLYVHLQAVAWAPLLVAALSRCTLERPMTMIASAGALAVSLSTTSVEIAAQAVGLGILLGPGLLARRRVAALSVAMVLGACLAAPTLFWMLGLVEGSARAGGFSSDVTLAHSIHPIGLLQVAVGHLFGDLSRPADLWWGQNFFPRGFPYLLSLYLGALPLGLAVLGAAGGGRAPRRIGLLGLLGVAVCLGRWGPWGPVVEALPLLRIFRYPSKAFFTVHLAVALLAAYGLGHLSSAADRRWKRAGLLFLALGLPLVVCPLLPGAAPVTFRWLLRGFFAPETPWVERLEDARHVLGDASRAGGIAVAGALAAILTSLGRLRPRLASVLLIALVSADLLRNGAGLNPMVELAFYRLSPEMHAVASALRAEGGRLFSFDPAAADSYWRERGGKQETHSLWSFATLAETLTPLTNVADRVPTAFSLDLTMLVPAERTLPPELSRASAFPTIRERLREAGVAHVISLDPLTDPWLRERAVLTPSRVSPLAVRVYDLADPVPLRYLADGRVLSLVETPMRIEARVAADRPTELVFLDSWAAEWTASVNGTTVPLRATSGHHRAVAVPAGESRVLLRYRPSRLVSAALLSASAALALYVVGRRGAPRLLAR
jgi:hypothetical protein